MNQEGVAGNRERFDQTFELMDEARNKVLALLQTVSQVQLDRRPAENEWSVGEIADHLALTERAYVGVAAELAARADPQEYDYGHVLKARRMSIEGAGDVSVTGKLASPPELVPASGKPLEDLLQELHDARVSSRRLLGPYRDQDLRGKFFLHRLFGPITLYERLAIIAYHDLKHLDQMERALARLKTPD